jgi:hypothetical protein
MLTDCPILTVSNYLAKVFDDRSAVLGDIEPRNIIYSGLSRQWWQVYDEKYLSLQPAWSILRKFSETDQTCQGS